MASVADRVTAARERLEAAGSARQDAAFEAELLARHVLGWDRAALAARRRDQEPPGFAEQLASLITRRAAREPVAQIVGSREFWGLDFEVTCDVLIPRPETEIIVEEAVSFARGTRCRHIIDVGTGSGCLAVSIAHELPQVRVTAVDTSEPALAVARRNAQRHGVADRVTFHHADLLQGVTEPAELIVANPPYVPDADAPHLQEDVIGYEPHLALFGGPTGLEIIARLLHQAPAHLAAGGRLIVEFGFGQSARVQAMAADTGWHVVAVREDLQSIPRTLVLSRNTDA